MELRREEIAVGSIRKGRGIRGQVLCDLPDEPSPAVQAFIGVVVVALWHRAAVSSGSAVVAAGGSRFDLAPTNSAASSYS
jgi:hypothetical protein